MSELESFQKTITDKTQKTQLVYRQQYAKLHKLLGNDISDASQDKLLKIVKDNIDNVNSQQAILNVAILIRKMSKLPSDKIVKYRESNKAEIDVKLKQANSNLQGLPSYDELVDYTDSLYEKKEYVDFIINWLILNYYVRNKDLVFQIVPRKKDMVNKDLNYIWIDVRSKKVVWVRNDYKTVKTHGVKKHIITDMKVWYAIKTLYYCQQRNDPDCIFIPNENQAGYYIKKSTYQSIGESNYIKIILNHHLENKNTEKLVEISESRGTNLQTLLTSYNIKHV